MRRGKINKPVYIYLVPKEEWPKKVKTIPDLVIKDVYIDLDEKTGKPLGYEFLDCYGVEVDGKEAILLTRRGKGK